jgi:type I restriction enzyme S subunit
MLGNWVDYTLGEIASFAYGKMPKSNVLTEGDYPTFSGYKYQYKYPEFNCDKGDVIVVARGVGGTGDVKIVKERCYLTNLSIKITLNSEKADNRYVYYNYLNSSLRHLYHLQ